MRSILAGIVGAETRATVGQGFHVSQTPPGWVDEWSGWETAAGLRIGTDNALEINAVYACVRVLAETLAQIPLILYRRRADGRGKDRALDHRLYRLLHDLPNPEMTSFELREALMGHLATWGNAYAEIDWTNDGQVGALWPLRPDRMESVKRERGELVYYYRLSGAAGLKALAAERVMHVRGLSFDGLIGYSPIQLQRQALAVGQAAQEFGARFFANDARPGGILEHPGMLKPEAHARLRESWEKRHQGLENKHRIAILEEGMKYHEIGLPPEDAQFVQTRKLGINDVARMYRVPPHMIQDLERATFSNIEHQSIDFVTFTMGPWFSRWEQAITRDLLLQSERQNLFAEFLIDALMRGDTQSRYEAYATARQNGWLSANDIRERENLNPIDNGDVYLVPLNMIPADQVGNLGLAGMESDEGARTLPQPAEDREQRALRSAAQRHRLMGAHMRLYRDVAARVLRREINDVGNQARKLLGKRDAPSFRLWLEEFYREHADFTSRQFRPLALSYGETIVAAARAEIDEPEELDERLERFIDAYIETFAAREGIVSRSRILDALDRALADGNLDVLTEIEAELAGWEEARSQDIAMWESVRFGNAVSRAAYVFAGIQQLRWVAFGESCPYCSNLNGKIVGVNDLFIPAGTDFQPKGAGRPLNVKHNVGHAPAHRGCDCMIAAA